MLIVRAGRNVVYAAIAVFLAAVLAGCAGGTDESSGSSARSAEGTRKPAPSASSPSDRGGGNARNAKVKQQTAATQRAVIYKSSLRVRADDVDAASAKGKQLVAAAGGFVDNEQATSHPAAATIAFKIPSDRYAAVLEQLTGQLGTKLALTQDAEDVTEQIADVDSRVRSAHKSLESFRKLLERAERINEIVDLEEEIETRQSDLEALQARQRSLKNSTAFATVTVTIEAPPKPATAPVAAKKKDEPGGLTGGLRTGWDAFTAFVSGAGMFLGVILPFAITAGVIVLPALAIKHRVRNGDASRAEPEPERVPEPAGKAEGPPPPV
ncbi:DUF4349 domain-containing protein [Spirillospora sp. CA-294931]|uniref:DUF4349 domain-containing protein n=1 Tax=Spirillospora sp. CA-294931 TaxID=3240042 RepID=UPI003D9401A0